MEDIEIVDICEEVLARLFKMDYERFGGTSTEQLIFPNKFPSKKKLENISEKELLKYIRRSEQELRQIFIDVFKQKRKDLFYSIETPTSEKYHLGKSYEELIEYIGLNTTSASLDMCLFQKDKENKYNRLLNIEFKHGNATTKDIAKDVLKLMREKENGVFIFLLDNTNSGSLNNIREDRYGVLDKLSKSFTAFHEVEDIWAGNENKHIQIIILSLEQKTKSVNPTLIYRTLVKENLKNLDAFFSINDNRSGNITTVNDMWLGIVPNK